MVEWNGLQRSAPVATLQSDPRLRVSMSFAAMACERKERIFFLILGVFFLIIFFFFFQSCYKGYSLHDSKLKNIHECIAQMLTSKLMQNKLFGVTRSFLPLELKTSQLVAYFRCPFSLVCVAASYGCCCSYCSCSIRIEKKITTQKQKKLSSKKNPRLSKPKKICHFQH
jgi:hypothetical protein